jgi:D-threo-aldose 1-dehydrogenase
MDPTSKARIGTTQLEVGRLGLGTVPIGGLYESVADDEAAALLRRSFELGVRLFDTAPQYGSGLAERRLGEVLPELPRSEIVVATKVGRLLRPITFTAKTRRVLAESLRSGDIRRISGDAAKVARRIVSRGDRLDVHLGAPFDQGEAALEPYYDFSYDGVMRSVDESLARLRIDRVDLLYIHDPDHHHDAALAGAFKALDVLRSDGRVAAIGVGMNQTQMLVRFANEAPFDCFLVAGRYTLLDQEALDSLIPACLRQGISLVVGGVFNSGILADPRPGSTFNYVPAPAPLLAKAQRIGAVCERHGVPLMAAAIQFPLGNPAVAAVLTGVRSVREIEENVAMFRVVIPMGLWDDLKAEGLLPADVPIPAPSSPITSDPVSSAAS